MSFISYAQNFEDVMLWRALKHIDLGFYIDVGANDPDQDSVTKAFYERGWRGINVEPVPQWFERLERARPRDVNLQLALGAEPGEITLYEIPDTGLSTAEKEFAERHEAEGGYQRRELRVKMDTLSRVCEKFHLAPIHFLKIDVEGAEKAVLQGADFGKIRPWIILLEATLPNSQEESYSDWEPLLLNAGYEYAYFDGLNRYYIAGEHKNLKAAFKEPPNVFDEFVRSQQLASDLRAQEAEAKIQEVQQLANQAEAHAQEAETKAQQADAKAEQAEASALQAQHRAAQAEATALQTQQWAAQAEAKALQAQQWAAQAEATTLQAQHRAAQVEARAHQAETKAQLAEERAAQAEATLQEVFRSRSWRVTRPLRAIRSRVRRLISAVKEGRVRSGIKWRLKAALCAGARAGERRPTLRRLLGRCLNLTPRLKRRISAVVTPAETTPASVCHSADCPRSAATKGSAATWLAQDLPRGQEQRLKAIPAGVAARHRSPLEKCVSDTH
jgi:FkbM family methyltransferase